MNKYRLIALFALLSPAIACAELTIEQLTVQARLVESAEPISTAPRWSGRPDKIVIRDRGVTLDEYEGVEIVLVESESEMLEHMDGADAIVGYCSEDLLNAGHDLVWVQIYWAGVERCLERPQLASGEVVLSNMQKMSSPAIAEHAFIMGMSLSRMLPSYGRVMDAGEWNGWRGDFVENMRPVAGQNLLVVGLGGIGSEVARLGHAMGMTVTGTRNSSRDGPDYVKYVGLSHELHDLAAEADIIVSALPLTTATRGIFDADFFAAAKPGALFVNVGRGASVVTADLMAALDSGQIGGAGLDVTDPEPLPPEHPLWQYHNVIITPHVAGAGGTQERHAVLLRENLRRFVAGEKLLNVVDPEKGY
ncbi:MAG: D-2-hydroxyacid dehydrogenase [Pseudomonadota bacterium]